MFCGAHRFEDWEQSVWLHSNRSDLFVPVNERLVTDSCCMSMSHNCDRRDHPSNIPYTVGTAISYLSYLVIRFLQFGLHISIH